MSLQVLEEFLVMLGVKADTEKVKSFGDALTKVGSIATVVVGALKTVSLAAWAFADGYVRRAEELYKANSSLFKITKEQVEMSKKYEDGMGRLGKIVESVKIKVAFGFLPTMLEMVNTFNEFLDANKDLIANGITKLLEVVSKLSQVINNTVRFIVKIIEATIGWKGALIVLVGVFVWLKRAMLLAFVTNPIFWVIAAIGVLMLLIDDFMTYLDGGESQFGDFWGSLLGWIKDNKEEIDNLVFIVKAMGHAIAETFNYFVPYIAAAILDFLVVFKAVWNMIAAIFDGNTELMKEAWDVFCLAIISMFQNLAMLLEPLAQFIVSLFVSAWESIVQAVSAAMETVAGIFSEAWNDTKASLSEAIASMIASFKGLVSGIGAALGNVFDIVTAPFAQAFDWIVNKFSSLGGLISGAVSGAKNLVGAGGAAAVSNNNVNSGGNMTINAPMNITSNNPVAAGKAVQSGLGSTMNTAKRNMGGTPKA